MRELGLHSHDEHALLGEFLFRKIYSLKSEKMSFRLVIIGQEALSCFQRIEELISTSDLSKNVLQIDYFQSTVLSLVE